MNYQDPVIPLAVVPTSLPAWDVGYLARFIEREIVRNTANEHKAASEPGAASLAIEWLYQGRVEALAQVLDYLKQATENPMPSMPGEDGS